MRDEIIKMAREAGFEQAGHLSHQVFNQTLERFFHMAQAAEREACAKVCEDISSKYKWPDDTAEKVASQWCADRIRARGQA